jgi:hypothetical protein
MITRHCKDSYKPKEFSEALHSGSKLAEAGGQHSGWDMTGAATLAAATAFLGNTHSAVLLCLARQSERTF